MQSASRGDAKQASGVKTKSLEEKKQQYDELLGLIEKSPDILPESVHSQIIHYVDEIIDYLTKKSPLTYKEAIHFLKKNVPEKGIPFRKTLALKRLSDLFLFYTNSRQQEFKLNFNYNNLKGNDLFDRVIDNEYLLMLLTTSAPPKLRDLTWRFSFPSSLETKKGVLVSEKWPEDKIDKFFHEYIQNLATTLNLKAEKIKTPTKDATSFKLKIILSIDQMPHLKKLVDGHKLVFNTGNAAIDLLLKASWQALKQVRTQHDTSMEIENRQTLKCSAERDLSKDLDEKPLGEIIDSTIKQREAEFEDTKKEIEKFLKEHKEENPLLKGFIAARLCKYIKSEGLPIALAIEIVKEANLASPFYIELVGGQRQNSFGKTECFAHYLLIIPTIEAEVGSPEWWENAVVIDPYFIRITTGKEEYRTKELPKLISAHYGYESKCSYTILQPPISTQSMIDLGKKIEQVEKQYLESKKQIPTPGISVATKKQIPAPGTPAFFGYQLRKAALDKTVPLAEFKKIMTQAIKHNQLNSKGKTTPYTALHLATLSGDIGKVRCLLDSKSDAMVKDSKKQKTALTLAKESDNPNSELIVTLEAATRFSKIKGSGFRLTVNNS